MDVSGSSFANQLMVFSNPQIQAYSSSEFDDLGNAYSAPISHEIAAQSYISPEERRENISGFKLDRELSDRRHAIYKHQRDKRVVTGFRGTDSKNPRDIATDLALTVGAFKRTKHSKDAVKKQQEVYAKYGKDNTYHLSGHSLGSKTSRYVHKRLPKTTTSSVGFNTPGSITENVADTFMGSGLRNKKQKLSRIDFINRTDPVSIFAHKDGRQRKRLQNGYSPHDLAQWYNQ